MVILAIVWVVFRFFLDFDGLYGQDSYEYLRYTKALNLYFRTGTFPGDYFWPLYYPIAGAVLSFVLKPVIALQLVSFISYLIVILYSFKIIKLIYPQNQNARIFCMLFLGLSPYMLRLSLSVMSDMLSTAFVVLCFYNGFFYFKTSSLKSLYLVVIFGLSAIMTRYATFVVLLPLSLYTLYIYISRKEHFKHLPFFILTGAILLLPHYLIRYENTTEFLQHNWLKSWSVQNFYKRSFTTPDGTNYNFLPNIIYAFSSLFHPRYLFSGILFFPFLFKNFLKKRAVILLTLSFLAYSFFLSGIPFQNSRFLIVSFPLLLIILYPGFQLLAATFLSLKIYIATGIATFVLQLFLCYLALKPAQERNHLEKEIAQELIPYQNAVLYSFDMDVALQGRGLHFEYQNLWQQEYVTVHENSLLLFNSQKFSRQWEGKNPMKNWNFISNNYRLQVLEELPEGWKLYKIISPIE
ncbi:hypothetical protein NHF50_08630 [Flavobacterium sp. NRK F10]|uniref:ArnT family glycosyltransferase n=1 Tax=Flavobacterium sp. NRK F10 TaxID=2954931 RepID=UPI002090997B|nr:glycosyltransferase family 39 protein [Flavobacterium sp. NRK F10]MCO6175112.1 hypothetical protein [Flavobacterium sp. NRK F10]